MLMRMIGIEIVRDNLPGRIVKRMDVAATGVVGFVRIGRGHGRVVIGQDRLVFDRHQETTAIIGNANFRCGRFGLRGGQLVLPRGARRKRVPDDPDELRMGTSPVDLHRNALSRIEPA
jgi:hypothetical protein